MRKSVSEKGWKKDAEIIENDSKIKREMNEKWRRFLNPRFLYFCKAYNVKIVF